MSGGFSLSSKEDLIAIGKETLLLYDVYKGHLAKIETIKQQIQVNWKGANDCRPFIAAMDSFNEDFKRLGECMADVGRFIGEQGVQYGNAEQAIANLAAKMAQRPE